MPLLKEADSLEKLNNILSRWIDQDYHQRIHSSIAQSPLNRYLSHLKALRAAPPDIREYFRIPAKRKVDKDRSVSLKGRLYEAPVGLIGQTVTLLYHKHDPGRIEVIFNERSYGFLTPLDMGINSRIRRTANQHIELMPTEHPAKYRPYQGGSLFEEQQ